MKKRIIIFVTILMTLSLLLFGYTNWIEKETKASTALNDTINTQENPIIFGPHLKVLPDLFYAVDTRFVSIKKTDIDKATTIYDFLNDEEKRQIGHVNSVNIVIIKNNEQSEISEYGTSEQLNEDQLKLLRATDYFNHFKIRTEFKEKNAKTGKLETRFFDSHITVVPEKQATYENGKEMLIQHLKSNIRKDLYDIDLNNLGALKISFVITTAGKISDVKYDAMTTRYPDLDKKLLTLIKNIPDNWIPAENANGEKIEQEFVFTFGPADGC